MKRFGTVAVKKWSQDLRLERLRRGLSLQDVAGEAGISISLLKALEQGRFGDIGSPVLVRAHLWAYAQALGNSRPPSLPEPASCPVPTIAAAPDPAAHQSPRLPAVRKDVPGLVACFAIGLMALGVCYQLGWFSPPDRRPTNPQASQQEASPESSGHSETTPGASPPAEFASNVERPSDPAEPHNSPGSMPAVPTPEQEAGTEPPKPFAAEPAAAAESVSSQPLSLHHRFEIEALQASWVEIKIDGGKTEGFLLRPGEKKNWEVVQGLQILLGNAGGVRMMWDDAPVNLGGRPGQVLRLRLPHPNLTGKSS